MKPLASLSLDLDNKWAYLKTQGDPAWRDLPSYLDVAVPRALTLFDELGLRVTFFVVGQDAALPSSREPIAAIAAAGHEVGNHSFSHEPWLHNYDAARLRDEVVRTEDAIEAVTGQRPIGFRGPGYSLSAPLLALLAERGYAYDASTLPTWIGPLARAYYFRSAQLDAAERRQRSALFGSARDGLRPITAYEWRLPTGRLLEVPVTTMPLVKLPFHVSYLLYLHAVRPALAAAWFAAALRLCRMTGTQPSLLLHPLDLLGADDDSELGFFPAMGLPGGRKRELVVGWLTELTRRFEVLPLGKHADSLRAGGRLALHGPEVLGRAN